MIKPQNSSIRNFGQLLLIVIPLLFAVQGYSQIEINWPDFINDNGGNTDDGVMNYNQSESLSGCTSISFSVQYDSDEWLGSGNLEYSNDLTQCGSGSGCDGDPFDPEADGCFGCWDFLYFDLSFEGSSELIELIGTPSNLTTSFNYTWESVCLDPEQTYDFAFDAMSQTWATGETINLTNFSLICYEGVAEPDVTIDPSDQLCEGENLNLTVDPVFSDAEWFFETTNIGSGTDININGVTTASSGTYYVETTDVNGCSSSVEFDIDILPIPDVCPINDPIETCSTLTTGEAEIDLTSYDSEVNCFGVDDVLWFTDMGDIPDFPIIDPVTFQTLGGDVFAVTYNGTCYSNPTTVVLDVTSGIDPMIDLPVTEFCDGESIMFDVINTPSCPNCDYDWEGPPASGISETTTTSQYSVLNANSSLEGDWTVTVTDDSGCTGSSSIAITVSSPPTGSISGGGDLCPGYCTDFSEALTLDLNDGTAPYNVEIEVSIGAFNIPLTLPNFLPNGTVGLCVSTDVFTVPGLQDFDGDGLDDIVVPNLQVDFSVTLTGITDANGCAGTGSGVIMYSIQPEPDANDPGGPYELCAGELFDLTSYDDNINTTDPVMWFEDMDLTMPIADPTAFDPGSTPLTVFAVVDNGTCFSEVVSLELVVIATPMLDPIGDETSCEQYEFLLPSGSDLGSNVFYEDISGNQFFPGDITMDSGTYTAFAGDNPACMDMVTFALTILEQPSILFPTNELSGCGEIILPVIDVLDLDPVDGMSTYSTGSDQTGTIFNDGDGILETDGITTLYVFASNGLDCFDELTIDLNFTSNIEYILPDYPTEQCGDLELLAIGGSTPDVAYYTELDGGGDQYNPGDFLVAPGDYTLYVYDLVIDQTCILNSNESFTITLVEEPEIISPDDELTGCGEIILPEIEVINGNSNGGYELYAQGPNESGNTYEAGDAILESDGITALYAFYNSGADCFNEVEIELIFTSEIEFVLPAYPEEVCGDLILLPITGASPGAAYYTAEDGEGIEYLPGDPLVAPGTYTLYVNDQGIDQTCVVNANESFTVTLELEPVIDPIANVVACDATGFILPDITGNFLTGDEGYSTMTSGSGQTFEPGDLIDFSTTIYAYNTSASCPAQEVVFDVMMIPAPDAGDDNILLTCEGPQLNLNTFLSVDATPGGVFESDDATLTGANMDEWNTAGGTLNTPIVFEYIVTSTSPLCNPDTSEITITLSNDVSAGVAVMDSTICQGEFVDLYDLLEGESSGGYFVNQDNTTDTIFTGDWTAVGANGNFLYVLEDMDGCAGDQTSFNIGVTDMQTITVDIPDVELCTGQCTDMIFDASTDFNLDMQLVDQANGQLYDYNFDVSGDQTIQICLQGTIGDFGGGVLSLGEEPGIYSVAFGANPDPDPCYPDLTDLDVFTLVALESTEQTVEGFVCPGEPFEYNGESYTQNETLISFSINGCQETTYIIVEEYPVAENFENDTYCIGTMVEIAGNIYTEDTQIQLLLEDDSSTGCDSIIYVDIKFDNASYYTYEETICLEDSETIGGITYDFDTPMGSDTIIGGSFLGCDSIINVNLEFFTEALGVEPITICQGDTINILGEDFHADMDMLDIVLMGASANGCDSTVTVMVDFYTEPTSSQSQMICQGDTINILGVDFYAGMESMDINLMGAAANGCDSIVAVSIDFLPAAEIDTAFQKCEGDTLIVDGFTITDDNLNAFYTIPGNGMDCATVVNYTTTLFMTDDETIEASICQGETIMINGIEFSEAYTFDESTMATPEGCESTVTIIVTVEGGETSIEDQVIGNNTYQLNFQSDTAMDPVWSSENGILSCASCPVSEITVTEDTEVFLSTMTLSGCLVLDTILLSFIPEEVFIDIFTPNIFSPDDDNFNQKYTIFGTPGIVIDEFIIYDRWGNVVHSAFNFMTNDESAAWNGRIRDVDAAEGVYVGIIKYEDPQGVEQVDAFDLTLVR